MAEVADPDDIARNFFQQEGSAFSDKEDEDCEQEDRSPDKKKGRLQSPVKGEKDDEVIYFESQGVEKLIIDLCSGDNAAINFLKKSVLAKKAEMSSSDEEETSVKASVPVPPVSTPIVQVKVEKSLMGPGTSIGAKDPAFAYVQFVRKSPLQPKREAFELTSIRHLNLSAFMDLLGQLLGVRRDMMSSLYTSGSEIAVLNMQNLVLWATQQVELVVYEFIPEILNVDAHVFITAAPDSVVFDIVVNGKAPVPLDTILFTDIENYSLKGLTAKLGRENSFEATSLLRYETGNNEPLTDIEGMIAQAKESKHVFLIVEGE